MTYHRREKRNTAARFARPYPTSDEPPTEADASPFWPRSASLFLIGFVVATIFWWFADYQTQVPCPEPQLVLPEGASYYRERHATP